jgi:hypothetical protein
LWPTTFREELKVAEINFFQLSAPGKKKLKKKRKRKEKEKKKKNPCG